MTINPPPTGFTDKNGRVICYHDILEKGLVDKEYFWVIDDPNLGVSLLLIYGWTKEKLTRETAGSMVAIRG